MADVNWRGITEQRHDPSDRDRFNDPPRGTFTGDMTEAKSDAMTPEELAAEALGSPPAIEAPPGVVTAPEPEHPIPEFPPGLLADIAATLARAKATAT